jgi:hypothetical protein
MTPPTEPRTAAGRALLSIVRQQLTNRERLTADSVTQLILAIEAEASRIDVETLARAFVAVGMVIDGMTAAEARQMVEQLATEYQKLA